MPEQFGSYTVYEEIGVGGMASVHVAESKTFGRVALKRLHEYAATEPDTVRAFLDEARLVVHLKHPNIARTFEAGKVGDIYFIAMEYVPGHTLAQLVDRCAKTIGVMPFPVTVNILIQICDALEYAHSLNDELGKPLKIIHRDISPSNVILSSTGIAKLIDFGIAKATSSTVHSQVGVVKGKFGYMAPEYLKGKLDHRVDLWALGTVAHEMLTNRHLFDGHDDFKVLYNVKYADIVPPSRFNADVPHDFDVIVMTALQRDPDRRWQSAGAMRTALVNAANELQTTVTNAQLIEWVHWTFTQAPPKEGSELSQLIKLFERPSKLTHRHSSEYDLSFETSETDPFARESKKSLALEAGPGAIANASIEVVTTTPFERKEGVTPLPRPSEPAVTTPFRKDSEPGLTKPFARDAASSAPARKLTPPPFETKTPSKPIARITPVSIAVESGAKPATKTPDPDRAPAPVVAPRRPTPVPLDPARAPLGSEASTKVADVEIPKSRRPTPLPLAPEPARRPTPARLSSEPPIRPTPVSFDDLPKLEPGDAPDSSATSALDVDDELHRYEAETKADKPLPATPAPARPRTVPQRRSKLRPWLLFVLLLAVVFAVWNYGFLPYEITDFLGIPPSGPIELDF